MNEKKTFADKSLQLILGNVLRYGVWTALITGFIGGGLYLARHGQEPVNYSTFKETNKTIGRISREVLNGVAQGKGRSIIFLGIFMLFLTPALRIVLSLFAFLIEKDYLYVVISLIVIIILGISIYLGYGH